MAASVAHQVGTPLNLISGYVQMIQEDASADPRNARRLQIVLDQIARVASVVRTLLDQSRREGHRQPIEIGSLLSRVADVSRPKLDASGIGLSLDVAAGLPPIVGDPEELELAILNLVSNAFDAMPSGGVLTIRAFSEGSDVRFDVSDTGSGIDPDLLPRVFQPWVTTKPAGHGTGLGLSITHDVVTRHGGTITAASEPGRTTFTIVLPSSNPSGDIDGQSADR
jgi:signal transduction histidine kinase